MMGSIYKIENIVNGKCYYGQTMNSHQGRKSDHFSSLKKGRHYNDHLQSSFNKYGEEAFTFTVISDSEANDRLDGLEQQLIEIFQTMNPAYGYNKESGGNANKKVSIETRERLRQAQIKYRRDNPESKDAQSKYMREYYASGGCHHMQGKSHSPDAKEKLRMALLGGKRSQESIEKGRMSRIGKKHSAETIEKMRVAQQKKASLDSYINPRKGKKNSAEHIRKTVESKARLRASKS